MEVPVPPAPSETLRRVTLVIPVDPVPQPRQRHMAVVRNGRALSRNYVDGKHRIHEFKFAVRRALQAALEGMAPLTAPYNLSCLFVFRRPAYLQKKDSPPERIPCDKRIGDLDNLAKAVMDTCNQLAYQDDCQVTTLFVTKVWAATGELPHVFMVLEEAPSPLRGRGRKTDGKKAGRKRGGDPPVEDV